MSFQDETKARRILDRWRGASEAHIRSDRKRVYSDNYFCVPFLMVTEQTSEQRSQRFKRPAK